MKQFRFSYTGSFNESDSWGEKLERNLGEESERQFFSAEVRGFGDSSSGFKIVLYGINSLAEVLSEQTDEGSSTTEIETGRGIPSQQGGYRSEAPTIIRVPCITGIVGPQDTLRPLLTIEMNVPYQKGKGRNLSGCPISVDASPGPLKPEDRRRSLLDFVILQADVGSLPWWHPLQRSFPSPPKQGVVRYPAMSREGDSWGRSTSSIQLEIVGSVGEIESPPSWVWGFKQEVNLSQNLLVHREGFSAAGLAAGLVTKNLPRLTERSATDTLKSSFQGLVASVNHLSPDTFSVPWS
nr:hypothetical protein Iba_chr13bCG9170 [Ipomoea batatas]